MNFCAGFCDCPQLTVDIFQQIKVITTRLFKKKGLDNDTYFVR